MPGQDLRSEWGSDERICANRCEFAKKACAGLDSNLESPAPEADALSIRPTGRFPSSGRAAPDDVRFHSELLVL